MNIISNEEIEFEFKRLTDQQDNVPNHCFTIQPTIVDNFQFDMELLKESLGGELQYA